MEAVTARRVNWDDSDTREIPRRHQDSEGVAATAAATASAFLHHSAALLMRFDAQEDHQPLLRISWPGGFSGRGQRRQHDRDQERLRS